jgi:hypothetical protein
MGSHLSGAGLGRSDSETRSFQVFGLWSDIWARLFQGPEVWVLKMDAHLSGPDKVGSFRGPCVFLKGRLASFRVPAVV